MNQGARCRLVRNVDCKDFDDYSQIGGNLLSAIEPMTCPKSLGGNDLVWVYRRGVYVCYSNVNRNRWRSGITFFSLISEVI